MGAIDERHIIQVLKHILDFVQREKRGFAYPTKELDIHGGKPAIVVGDVGVWNPQLVSIVVTDAQLHGVCRRPHVCPTRLVDDPRAEVVDFG